VWMGERQIRAEGRTPVCKSTALCVQKEKTAILLSLYKAGSQGENTLCWGQGKRGKQPQKERHKLVRISSPRQKKSRQQKTKQKETHEPTHFTEVAQNGNKIDPDVTGGTRVSIQKRKEGAGKLATQKSQNHWFGPERKVT